MPKSGPFGKLKRYTHLPALLHLVQTRTLTVLNPSTWADQNDTTYLKRYKEKHPDIKGLFALCMTEAADTFHHWSVYASGPSGVKIEFDPDTFQTWLQATDGTARLERVRYKKLNEVDGAVRDTKALPFLKRLAFRDENEVRLLVEDRISDGQARDLPNFDLSAIRKISLSPWLPIALEDTVRDAIHHACGEHCDRWGATVRRTSLLYNKLFAGAGE